MEIVEVKLANILKTKKKAEILDLVYKFRNSEALKQKTGVLFKGPFYTTMLSVLLVEKNLTSMSKVIDLLWFLLLETGTEAVLDT